MPFYTFKCNSCDSEFEIMCTIAEKDSGSIVCPDCGANELDRIFEGFTVSVKGASCDCPSAKTCCAGKGGCPHAAGRN